MLDLQKPSRVLSSPSVALRTDVRTGMFTGICKKKQANKRTDEMRRRERSVWHRWRCIIFDGSDVRTSSIKEGGHKGLR